MCQVKGSPTRAKKNRLEPVKTRRIANQVVNRNRKMTMITPKPDSSSHGREQALGAAHRVDPGERALRKHASGRRSCSGGLRRGGSAGSALAGPTGRPLDRLYRATALLQRFRLRAAPHTGRAPFGRPFPPGPELERLGWPAESSHAILGHAEYSGVPRNTTWRASLFSPATSLPAPRRLCAGQARPLHRMRWRLQRAQKMKDKAFAPRRQPRRHVREPPSWASSSMPTSPFCIRAVQCPRRRPGTVERFQCSIRRDRRLAGCRVH